MGERFFDLHLLPTTAKRSERDRAKEEWRKSASESSGGNVIVTLAAAIATTAALYLVTGVTLILNESDDSPGRIAHHLLFLVETTNLSREAPTRVIPQNVSSTDLAVVGVFLTYLATALALTLVALGQAFWRSGLVVALGGLIIAFNAQQLSFIIALELLRYFGEGPVLGLGSVQIMGASILLYCITLTRDIAIEMSRPKRLSDHHFSLVFDYGASALIAAYMSTLSGDFASGVIFGLLFAFTRAVTLVAFDLSAQWGLAVVASGMFLFGGEQRLDKSRHWLPRFRVIYRAISGGNVLARCDALLDSFVGLENLKAPFRRDGAPNNKIYWAAVVFFALWMCAAPPYVAPILWAWIFR